MASTTKGVHILSKRCLTNDEMAKVPNQAWLTQCPYPVPNIEHLPVFPCEKSGRDEFYKAGKVHLGVQYLQIAYNTTRLSMFDNLLFLKRPTHYRTDVYVWYDRTKETLLHMRLNRDVIDDVLNDANDIPIVRYAYNSDGRAFEIVITNKKIATNK